MPLAYPRRSLAGMAGGLVAACLALTSTAAGADQVRGQEWWLQALHVTQAWQSSRGSGVTVAVLDTGVDPHQADLVGSVRGGPDYTGSGRVAGGPYWGIHGTAVASLIAGHGHGSDDSDGIIGIAPAAKILSVRVTLESNDPLLTEPAVAGALPEAIARGIRYAVTHHASVIDLPLDPVTVPGAAGAGGSAAERSAVRYALRRRVVLVAPAGDNGAGADAANYPAAYRGVISVGAFNSGFARAIYSNRQPYVTLTAAGDGVIAADPPSGYADLSSTSAASAVVAGIAALIRAQFPRMSPAKVTKALTEGTVYHRPSQRLHGSGYGTADAAAALAAAARIEEAVPSQGQSAAPTAAATHTPPTPPAIRPTSKSLGGMLRADAGIAAGVFVILLLSIVGFGWLRRRRARAARLAEVRSASRLPVPMARQTSGSAGVPPRPAAAALPAGSFPGALGLGEGAFGAPGAAESGLRALAGRDGLADRAPGAMAGAARAESRDGLLAGATAASRGSAPQDAPGALAAGPRQPGATMFGGPPGAGAGKSGGGRPGARAVEQPGASDAAAGAGGTAAAAAGRALSGARIVPSRTPKVSGTPPWEPAARPDGEVPWGRSASSGGMAPDSGPSANGPGGLPRRARRQPEMSVWDSIAEEAWPGGPQAGRKRAQPGSKSAGARPGEQGGPDASPDGAPPDQQETAIRPIYVWNPGATTDKLPAIRPDAGGGQSSSANRT